MWIWASEREVRAWVEGMKQLIELAASGNREQASGAREGTRGSADPARPEGEQVGELDSNDSLGQTRAGARGASSPIQQPLVRALGRKIELSTIGGSIQGVLTEIGDGFAVVRESEELVVVANLDHAIYVEVSGE